MYTRKQALAIARQVRTCPPQEVRDDPGYRQENQQHLAICPFCSTGLGQALDAAHALSREFGKKVQGSGKQAVLPGQVWRLNKALACWRNHYFYREPVVVVLEDYDQTDGAILVAQTWHDIYLAAPGDLIIPKSMLHGPEELFVETWNMYTLKKEALEDLLGTVDPRGVAAALKMRKTPGHLPSWAQRPMALGTDDPRHYFQKLEIETGYTFAVQAAGQLMAALEKSAFEFISDSKNRLMEKIRQILGGIDWSWTPRTIEECLGALRFPPEAIPLSAAARDHQEVFGACFVFKEGHLDSFSPVSCRILDQEWREGHYTLSGEVPELPHGLETATFNCYLENKTAKTLAPGTWVWDENIRYFLIRFPRKREASDRLSIVIIHHIQAENKT